MLKIVIAIITFVFSVSVINAGFDCDAEIENIEKYQDYTKKIDNLYSKIWTQSLKKQIEIYKQISHILQNQFSESKKLIKWKYWSKSEEYTKINTISKKIYCINRNAHTSSINSFTQWFLEIYNLWNSDSVGLNGSTINRLWEEWRSDSHPENIDIDMETFSILTMERRSLVAAVDKNFLYFNRSWWLLHMG